MEKVFLSNFFVPKTSRQLSLKAIADLNLKPTSAKTLLRTLTNEARLPIGLSDGWKINKEYKELTELLEVNTFSWEEALKGIQSQINTNKVDNICSEILDQLDAIQQTSEMNIDQQVTESELEVIVLWKTSRLSNANLALKTHQTLQFVESSIKQYKMRVKEQKILRKQNSAKKRRVIDEAQVERIKEYWWRNRSHMLTIRKIKDNWWKNKNTTSIPSNSTIRKVLKRKLRMSYKTLSTRHPKSTQANQQQLFLQSALIQLQLSKNNIQFVFIDEFSLTWRN